MRQTKIIHRKDQENPGMTSTYAESFHNANIKTQWSRDEVSMKIIDFENRKGKLSQREFAMDVGVPRTTLQNWLNRMDKIDEAPAIVAFFESPAGVKFLHTLIQALHFEFTKVGCASIRNICNFLKLTRLSSFGHDHCQYHGNPQMGSALLQG
ncbi:helix-turn-helix transcriptional regulator [uncultured Desulfobacter sp.]|uniref:helix-turn-helix transcriptional regulator n=1 Tax=uncultured Desulfobacter sp. TaxID=240139 RepID=UPI002AAB0436|nr:helix-turn-helix transcriptional regulator [uncultured Desulfobacter sp.]